MRYFFVLFILFFSAQSFGSIQKIAAIVNNDPITMQEFLARKKMIISLNRIGHLNPEQSKNLEKAVMDGLIEEQLIKQEGEKIGTKVTDDEITAAISGIEERNKMPKGQLAVQMSSSGVDPATFKTKIKIDLLKNKIVSESLARGLAVSPNEVDAAVLDTNSKDASVILKVITSKDSNEKSYSKMITLSKKLPSSCDQLKKQSYDAIANLDEITTKLSQLSTQEQIIVKDMDAGNHSEVVKVGNDLKIYMLCSKKIENFSSDETNYIINFLGNKKLYLKSQKYIENLRKKAYIKIMI